MSKVINNTNKKRYLSSRYKKKTPQTIWDNISSRHKKISTTEGDKLPTNNLFHSLSHSSTSPTTQTIWDSLSSRHKKKNTQPPRETSSQHTYRPPNFPCSPWQSYTSFQEPLINALVGPDKILKIVNKNQLGGDAVWTN